MKLFRIKRTDQASYDEYDSLVVWAESEETARLMHPGGAYWNGYGWIEPGNWRNTEWADPHTLEVEEVLEPLEPTIVLTSFRAG